ncbi:hypothetical protein AB2B38_008620 [Balneola sp. MJW-20]|uniref:hypothetical protein n=1 Tax=Gracilimonas aurantiaca TaxID=3234185 RepID=UPI003467BAC7
MMELFISMGSHAQFIPGARPLALGSAVTALPGEDWALFGNPALMIAEKVEVNFYGGRYYGLEELTDIAFRVSAPILKGTVSGGFHRYGNELFNEMNFRGGYSRMFDKFSVGLAMNYRRMGFGGSYDDLHRISLDTGISAELTGGLTIGGRINPVWSQVLNGAHLDADQEIAAGLSYAFQQRHYISIDAVKDIRFPLSFRAGIEVELVPVLQLRAGMTTEPETFSGGIGLELSNIKAGIAVQRHWLLGLSPGMDLSIRL